MEAGGSNFSEARRRWAVEVGARDKLLGLLGQNLQEPWPFAINMALHMVLADQILKCLDQYGDSNPRGEGARAKTW